MERIIWEGTARELSRLPCGYGVYGDGEYEVRVVYIPEEDIYLLEEKDTQGWWYTVEDGKMKRGDRWLEKLLKAI